MNSFASQILTVIPLILGAALSLQPALAQSNPAAEARLRRDVVTEQEGKFTIDRFSICQLFRPSDLGGGASEPFQVKSHMEAAADGFISRDNFLTFSTEIGFQLRVSFAADFIPGLTAIEAIGALQCKPLEAPIGKVDLELDVFMTADGVQVGMLETGSGERDPRPAPGIKCWDNKVKKTRGEKKNETSVQNGLGGPDCRFPGDSTMGTAG